MYIIKINTEDFEKIKKKEKTIEVSLVEGMLVEVSVGASILFKKEPDLIEGVVAKVTDIKFYNSFLEMAKILSIKAMGLGGMNAEEVSEFYINKFTSDKEKSKGVMAIKFEVL